MAGADHTIRARATGPIPEGYVACNNKLTVDGQDLTRVLAAGGDTPLFVYSRAMVAARLGGLRAGMPPRLAIHYAMKANPFPPLLGFLRPLVDGFDIASGKEMEYALAAGAEPSQISFAGPGKRDGELRAALISGITINLESEGEADRALAIAAQDGLTARLAVRVNPDFGLKGSGMKMGGGAGPFGVDAPRVPALVKRIIDGGADWRGFHIYAGSQALSADAIIAMHLATIELTIQLAEAIGRGPRCVNLGGGFGIPYFAGDAPLDIQAVGGALAAALQNLPPIIAETQYCIELGRYLVGEAGVYLTRILDRKVSQGEIFLVTDGGLHHMLAASGNFGSVIRRNYPVAIASRFGAQPQEVANIVGCLCTPLDLLAHAAELPSADVGDIVAIFCAGAYGASASPANFLGHGAASEILI